MNPKTLFPPFPRAVAYIGQNHIVKALDLAFVATQVAPICRAAYIEARGGQGKTFFLQQIPTLLADSCPKAVVARIVDLYDSETRQGSAIELRIIDGLKAEVDQSTEPEQWYRFSAIEVDSAFSEYLAIRKIYEDDRGLLAPQELARRKAELREKFICGYNTLAGRRPLVLCFDTTEALVSQPPVYKFLGDTFPTPAANVEEWVENVLPQLQHTLAVFCGRPIPEPGHPVLYEACLRKQLLDGKLRMEELTRDDIQPYFSAYEQPQPSLAECADIHKITAGRPLLLTCLIQSRTNPQMMPSSQEEIDAPGSFERFVLGYLLNPLRMRRPNMFVQEVLSYCLYILSYARRGVTREQLVEFMRQQDLPHTHSSFTPEQAEQFEVVLEHLSEVALIKIRQQTGLLFLHDEVYEMMDQYGLADALGLEEEVLSYLIALVSAEEAQATDPAGRFAALSNRIYYELAHNVDAGYRRYMIKTYHLFTQRDVDLTLILRDELWRWLHRTVDKIDAEGMIAHHQPNLDRLQEQGSLITYAEIQRDDAVWLVKYYLSKNQNGDAVRVGRQVREHFTSMLEEDEYYALDLTMHLGYALSLWRDDTSDEALENFQRAMEVLNKGDGVRQKFLRERIDFFRGEVYNKVGYAYRRRNDFDHAAEFYNRSRRAYLAYRDSGQGDFDVNDLLAQVIVNQIYIETQQGRMLQARMLARDLRNKPFFGNLSLDLQALVLNINSIVLMGGDDLDEALNLADRAAQQSKNLRQRRVYAQVAAQLATVYSAQMVRIGGLGVESTQVLHPAGERLAKAMMQADQNFKIAEEIFEEVEEIPSLRETLLEHGRYWYHLARFARHFDTIDGATCLASAFACFDRALARVGDPAPPILVAELLESKAVVCQISGDLVAAEGLLVQAEEWLAQAPQLAYVHLVSAAVAFTRAMLSLDRQQWAEAVTQFTLTLARCYTFSTEDTLANSYRRRISDILSEMMHPETEQIYRCLINPASATSMRATDLPYLVPEAERWERNWQRATEFLREVGDVLALSLEIV